MNDARKLHKYRHKMKVNRTTTYRAVVAVHLPHGSLLLSALIIVDNRLNLQLLLMAADNAIGAGQSVF